MRITVTTAAHTTQLATPTHGIVFTDVVRKRGFPQWKTRYHALYAHFARGGFGMTLEGAYRGTTHCTRVSICLVTVLARPRLELLYFPGRWQSCLSPRRLHVASNESAPGERSRCPLVQGFIVGFMRCTADYRSGSLMHRCCAVYANES